MAQIKLLCDLRLNRTFYGIETGCRPFMELKLSIIVIINVFRKVLIVPFMELKRIRINQTRDSISVLIVPFMELKLRILE